jgi:hypothetical protein
MLSQNTHKYNHHSLLSLFYGKNVHLLRKDLYKGGTNNSSLKFNSCSSTYTWFERVLLEVPCSISLVSLSALELIINGEFVGS